ncbi:hypothetical protein IRJ41_017028, partial [Triplophysa rosa]
GGGSAKDIPRITPPVTRRTAPFGGFTVLIFPGREGILPPFTIADLAPRQPPLMWKFIRDEPLMGRLFIFPHTWTRLSQTNTDINCKFPLRDETWYGHCSKRSRDTLKPRRNRESPSTPWSGEQPPRSFAPDTQSAEDGGISKEPGSVSNGRSHCVADLGLERRRQTESMSLLIQPECYANHWSQCPSLRLLRVASLSIPACLWEELDALLAGDHVQCIGLTSSRPPKYVVPVGLDPVASWAVLKRTTVWNGRG